MGAATSGLSAVRALVVASLLLVGCARKAPGPEECEAFAKRVFGVDDPRLLASPRVKKLVDEEVVSCLTTPYDRELVRCVDLHVPRAGELRTRLSTQEYAERCFAEFKARRVGPGRSTPEQLQ